MIRGTATAFSRAVHGDLRSDLAARRAWSAQVGAPSDWATLHQVHGSRIVRVDRAGVASEADALFTTRPGLGLAVFTADCAGVILRGTGGVGVAHAGWRGAVAGVVPRLLTAMQAAGIDVVEACIGPTIGPCCFEVGEEVAGQFSGHVTETTWGTTSVDLPGYLRTQLGGLAGDDDVPCTFHGDGYFSHRRTQSPDRMAALGWQ